MSVKLLSAGGDVNIGVVNLRVLSLSKIGSATSDRSDTVVISSTGPCELESVDSEVPISFQITIETQRFKKLCLCPIVAYGERSLQVILQLTASNVVRSEIAPDRSR